MLNNALGLKLSANREILSLYLDQKADKADLDEAWEFFSENQEDAAEVLYELTENIRCNSEYDFVDDLSSLGYMTTKSAFVTYKIHDEVDEMWLYDSDIYNPAVLLFRDGFIQFYKVNHS